MIVNTSSPRAITGYSSIILDSLRILAALIVFIHHIYDHWLPGKDITKAYIKAAHGGVVVFFVLSGFVIAYTTIVRNRGGISYLKARLSRLYSVLLPALAITAFTQIIIFVFNNDLYNHISRGPSFIRYIISGLFLNEIWFLSAAPPLNTPLWSLSYEFWYYIIFGLFLYRGIGFKWLLPSLIALIIAGPKIAIMMPIWFLGYLAYKYPLNMKNHSISWIFVGIFLLLSISTIAFLPAFPTKIGAPPLFFSAQFISDWITGLFIALALFFMPLETVPLKSVKLIKYIRKAADLTFPIYLLHYPLLNLYDAVIHNNAVSERDIIAPTISVLLVSSILGLIIENYRYLFKNTIDSIFEKSTVAINSYHSVFKK